MCGIAGKVYFHSSRMVSRDVLERMNKQLSHRGPDEEGLWIDGPVGLAMRRLSIIDLSAKAHQPMSNDTCYQREKRGVLHLVFNGEIYNYQELTSELQAKGHVFRSASDTEIILHAFEEYGENAWQRLNGMFAIALYSPENRTLYLVRDRMGIKPLYYSQDPQFLSFSSEIKSLIKDPEVSREWDLKALNEYFSLRYIPTPRSIFKNINKLEPGHFLRINIEKGTVHKKKYWHFNPGPLVKNPISYYTEKLDALLKQSVSSHLMSNVPVGVFLSGGLDSSTVASYVQQLGQPLDSFTIYFDHKSFSERSEAAASAKRFGLAHHEFEVKPNIKNLSQHLSAIFDEPFSDASVIPTYYLCEFARTMVTVALSGDGGDELLAGYPTYLADRYSSLYKLLPQFTQNILLKTAQKIPVSFNRISLDYKIKAFLAAAGRPQPQAHFGWQEMFFPDEKPRLYNKKFWEYTKDHIPEESFITAYQESGDREGLEKMLYVDQRTHLLDEYLVKMDRLSMAHSLEVRVPLLDTALVEFSAQIPMEHKLQGLTTKYILRRLMKNRLPQTVLTGAKKGFTPPLAHWLATDLKFWAQDILSPDQISRTGMLDPHMPHTLLKEHADKKRDNHKRLWTLISFMLWFNKYGGFGLDL